MNVQRFKTWIPQSIGGSMLDMAVPASDFDRILAERDALQQRLNELGEQHQGEPVAWRVVGKRNVTVGPHYPEWAEGDETLKIEALYTHADPGEVELLRNCLRTEVSDSWKREAQELRAQLEAEKKQHAQVLELATRRWGVIAKQDAKLAEAHALLRRAKMFIRNGVEADQVVADILAALSASAEPRPFRTPDCPDCACVQDGQCLCSPSKPSAESGAQKDWCSTMERPKSQCGCPDCGSSIVQMGEPNEPVERDERAAFELVIGQKWPGIRMLRINRPGAPADGEYELPGLEAAWQGWQAHAALERKP